MREMMLGQHWASWQETMTQPSKEALLTGTKEVPDTDAWPQFPRPSWTPDHAENLFFNSSPDRLGLEQFRASRTRLLRVRENLSLQTVLVASARPSDGKTFIAANLAQVLAAHTEDRVLLIDGDVRRPRLHVTFGAPCSPGLQECLSGEVDFLECIQQSPMEGLFFLPAGNCSRRSAELLAGSAFPDLLARLRRGFEWIVIDSPAALWMSDAAVLSEHCHGVLLVVRSGCTESGDLKQLCEQFDQRKILGVMLTGKPIEKRQAYVYDDIEQDDADRLRN
jgi:capsular exopolysaccharide synthesis family protein